MAPNYATTEIFILVYIGLQPDVCVDIFEESYYVSLPLRLLFLSQSHLNLISFLRIRYQRQVLNSQLIYR